MVLAAGHLIRPKSPMSRTGKVNDAPGSTIRKPDKVNPDGTAIYYG
jgi:hypothetical protein